MVELFLLLSNLFFAAIFLAIGITIFRWFKWAFTSGKPKKEQSEVTKNNPVIYGDGGYRPL